MKFYSDSVGSSVKAERFWDDFNTSDLIIKINEIRRKHKFSPVTYLRGHLVSRDDNIHVSVAKGQWVVVNVVTGQIGVMNHHDFIVKYKPVDR